ncbi:MAG: hypothetical protein Pg6C_04710 [Treponemataceae bacterium]|nr:MAG: hypothetical protein Pg6C_04710 [Treponemataceae bacterium]
MATDDTNNPAAYYDELAARIEEGAEHPEEQAAALETALDIRPSPENEQETRETVLSFVHSYSKKAPETQDVTWLEDEFAKHPDVWANDEERKNSAAVIVERVYAFEAEKRKLAECREKGISRESYLKTAIETGAKAQGVTDFGNYASKIDKALDTATRQMRDTVYTNAGGINQNPNLDGYIAEQHHVDTFNIEAAAQGKTQYHAERLGSNTNKSVDIVVKDENGIIRPQKYQSKYGADADTTQEYFAERSGYPFQRKLVPKGQAKDVPNSTEAIDFGGVKSKPLSKAEAKELQRKIQEEQEAKQYEWNEVNSKAIAKNIGQKAGLAAVLAVGFQGARILGRRIWNRITGKPNNPVEKDAEEFAKSAIESGASAGLTVAVTGGMTVAVKRGLLGTVLKSTPVGHIANAVCVGIENVKILAEFATGKITGEEALNKAGDATTSLVGSLALGAKGAAVGAAIGTVLGPVGAAIGGIAGGIVGGIAGSTVGHAIWEGGKAIVKTVGKVIRGIGEGIKNAASGFVNGIKAVGRGIGKIFGKR